MVITTVSPRPGGLEITVRRVSKGGAARDASMVLPTGSAPDKLDGIAPLFGGPPPAVGKPAITTDRPASDAPSLPPPNTVQEPEPSSVVQTAAPSSAPIDDPTRHRLEIAGMAGGGALAVVGLILWGAAHGVQNDIDNAPTVTRQNLMDLRDLESKGDTYATLGNVFVITGVVVGGISTFLYFRDRRAASHATAHLTPAVFAHGAGLALTFGGTP
jgi:hypothetical protein